MKKIELSEEQKKEIIDLYEKEIKVSEIGRKIGLGKYVITNFLKDCGTIETKKSRLRIGFLGTENFLNNTQKEICEYTNIPKTKIFQRGNIFMLTFGRKMFNEKIYEYFYKDATVFLERKQKVFLAGL